MVEADEVFNPKDFESVRLLVRFKNLTTRTEVKNPHHAKLIELGDKTLGIELPAKSCNSKHNVMVDISRVDKSMEKGERHLFGATGKVIDVENLEDDRMRITMDCLQYEEKCWNELLAVYSSRQNDIEKFLAAAKG